MNLKELWLLQSLENNSGRGSTLRKLLRDLFYLFLAGTLFGIALSLLAIFLLRTQGYLSIAVIL